MTVTCEACGFVAPDKQAVIAHWEDQARRGNKHWHCLLCVKVFYTEGGWDSHRRQVSYSEPSKRAIKFRKLPPNQAPNQRSTIQLHAKEQQLDCPGCDKLFTRAGGLIDHFERDLCTKINNAQLAARRDEKLAFARELQRRHFGLDPDDDDADDDNMSVVTESTWVDTKGPANFSKYLTGSVVGSMAGSISSTSALRPAPQATSRPNPVLFRMRDTEFPPIISAQIGDANSASKNSQWGNKQLFPNSPPAVQQAAENKKPEFQEWDPENPRFKASTHFNQFSRKYKCPHPNCFKSFGSPTALTGHLSSPAHRNYLKVQCPACLRWFDSMAALTQHSESQAERCNVRDTEEFRQFLDQMTAGVVDTVDHHEDGTNKYTVPAEAQKLFGGQDRSKQLREQAHRAAQDQVKREVEKKKTYWDNHEVKW